MEAIEENRIGSNRLIIAGPFGPACVLVQALMSPFKSTDNGWQFVLFTSCCHLSRFKFHLIVSSRASLSGGDSRHRNLGSDTSIKKPSRTIGGGWILFSHVKWKRLCVSHDILNLSMHSLPPPAGGRNATYSWEIHSHKFCFGLSLERACVSRLLLHPPGGGRGDGGTHESEPGSSQICLRVLAFAAVCRFCVDPLGSQTLTDTHRLKPNPWML